MANGVGRTVARLTALKVSRASKPGMYADGAGLYLQVAGGGSKSWIFRYMLRGRAREMGLGSLSVLSLADARNAATECRRLRHQGIDPIEAREARRAQAALEVAKAIVFKECAEKYIAAHEASWRNDKHRAQWKSTLATYVYPELGALSVQTVDTGLVLKVLEPIWSTKPETAGRIRGRIEVILDWAKARGYREGENPARWRGHLDKLLTARSKIAKAGHHAALPYPEVPQFMTDLRERNSISARALEFTVLTAARTGETMGARWPEIDMTGKVWTIPGERMKGGREHRVPLCPRAIEILEALPREGEFVFAGGRPRKPISNMAMAEMLKGMGYGPDRATVHGFRSTFKDWATERTNFVNEVSEAALAHVVGDKTEAAYRRGDVLEKRRRLMDAWAEYC